MIFLGDSNYGNANSSSEANFFNDISNGDYDVLAEADYNVFLEIINHEIIGEKSYLIIYKSLKHVAGQAYLAERFSLT